MIRDCPHLPHVVIGGWETSVCSDCRAENIRTFYASGPLLPSAKTNSGKAQKKTHRYRDLHAPSMPEHEDGWVGE